MSPRQKVSKDSKKPDVKQTITTDNSTPQNDGQSNGQDNNLEKVRDLLFGSAIRESHEKHHELEARFSQKLERFQQDVHAQLETLSNLIQKTSEDLSAALKSENSQRQQEVDALLKKLDSASQSISDLDTQTMVEQKQMAERFENDFEQLKNEFGQLHKQAMSHIEASAGTLESNKTDREFLANLLNDLSARLQKGE